MEKDTDYYQRIINSIEVHSSLPSGLLWELISDYLVNVKPDLETVTLKLEGESHTSKLGNLKFRLKELIELIMKTAATWGTTPISIVWSLIQFIKEARKLSTIPISKNDAKVLVAIWMVKLEKPSSLWPNTEEVQDYLKKELTEDAIEISLSNLQKLECIDRTDQHIEIEEEIEF